MNVPSRSARSFLLSLLAGVALAALVLPLLAIANQSSLLSTAQTANASNARAEANLINAVYVSDVRAARDLELRPGWDTEGDGDAGARAGRLSRQPGPDGDHRRRERPRR